MHNPKQYSIFQARLRIVRRTNLSDSRNSRGTAFQVCLTCISSVHNTCIPWANLNLLIKSYGTIANTGLKLLSIGFVIGNDVVSMSYDILFFFCFYEYLEKFSLNFFFFSVFVRVLFQSFLPDRSLTQPHCLKLIHELFT